MTFYGKIDDVLIIEPPQYGLETIDNINVVSVSWKQKIPYGSHQVEFGISYIPNDNTSVVLMTHAVKLEKEKEPTFLGLPMWIWNLIVALVVLAIISAIIVKAYNRVQERKWLAEYELEEFDR
jgi:hypothetical protein